MRCPLDSASITSPVSARALLATAWSYCARMCGIVALQRVQRDGVAGRGLDRLAARSASVARDLRAAGRRWTQLAVEIGQLQVIGRDGAGASASAAGAAAASCAATTVSCAATCGCSSFTRGFCGAKHRQRLAQLVLQRLQLLLLGRSGACGRGRPPARSAATARPAWRGGPAARLRRGPAAAGAPARRPAGCGGNPGCRAAASLFACWKSRIAAPAHGQFLVQPRHFLLEEVQRLAAPRRCAAARPRSGSCVTSSLVTGPTAPPSGPRSDTVTMRGLRRPAPAGAPPVVTMLDALAQVGHDVVGAHHAGRPAGGRRHRCCSRLASSSSAVAGQDALLDDLQLLGRLRSAPSRRPDCRGSARIPPAAGPAPHRPAAAPGQRQPDRGAERHEQEEPGQPPQEKREVET